MHKLARVSVGAVAVAGTLAVTLALALAASLVVVTAGQSGASTTAAAPATTHHFIANLDGAMSAPKQAGFTVFDTGTSGLSSLPAGVKALVWLGQKCPTMANASFKATIQRMSHYQRVFGYYLSDEPHLADCPGGPAALASRADYIRSVTKGTQKSFIVLDKHDGSYADYTNFRPAVTHVAMVGLDAYPCHAGAACELSKINERVAAARNRGFPMGRVVPVYQAFGQGSTADPYYRMPSATELRQIVGRWAALVPSPPMDYAYGWSHQGSANPTLRDSPSLQATFKSLFAG